MTAGKKNKTVSFRLVIDTDTETKTEILTQILSEPLIGFKEDLSPSYLSLGEKFNVAMEGVEKEYQPEIISRVAHDIHRRIGWLEYYMPGSPSAGYIDKPSFQPHLPDYVAQAEAEKAFDDLADKASKFKNAMPTPLHPAYDDIFRALMTRCIPANFAKAEDYPDNWRKKIDARFPASDAPSQPPVLNQITKSFRPF